MDSVVATFIIIMAVISILLFLLGGVPALLGAWIGASVGSIILTFIIYFLEN